ncbi:hypothetical protein PNEG_01312 [Pneumocystis murina B123]|uniref:Origin recognition complex subunit 3 n=1 Tax=Pneumocystis murina (strain B123) TaxID=1069680 RepID=M7PJG8_PNEMU|nr:hypothetical protein PNEG_01312 [Pneumocystis murina B123]EMR10609.1 hypothetical protein PNEG_01312 [Pneumocystis murina B123]
MGDDVVTEACYMFLPKDIESKKNHIFNKTQDELTSKCQQIYSDIEMHITDMQHKYKQEEFLKYSESYFPCLMHGRETELSRNYRYMCFRLQSNQLKNDINELLETIHDNMVASLSVFIEQNKLWKDENKIPTCILLLGAYFFDHIGLYACIEAQLKANIYGPFISLHVRRTPDMKACFKQIIETCIQFGQQTNLNISTEKNPEERELDIYCDYDPECVARWYEEAIFRGLINQDQFRLVIFLQEVEGFDGNFFNHFITILKKMHKRVPLLLFIGISTSVEIFQDILEKKSLKALNIKYFNTKHSNYSPDIAIEKILVSSKHPKLRLGPHLYYTLFDMYQKHSFNIASFLSAIKFATMSHFFSNPISIVNHCNSAHSELISHDHLECLRSLPSIKRYIEDLLDKGDIYSAESLLNDDYYFRNIINTLIHDIEEHNKKLDAFIFFLNIIQGKYASSVRKKSLSWIYGKLLENDIQRNLDTILNPIKIMNSISILQFIQEALALKDIHDQFPDLEDFYRRISDIVELSEDKNLIHISNNETNSCSKTEEISNKAYSELNDKVIGSEFYNIRNSLYEYLQEIFRKYFISPMTYPLHELYYFNYSRAYLDAFHPRIRAAIDTALSLPSHYLSCNYEAGDKENENSLTISSLPKICISYRLFLESGFLINVSDWLTAFIQSASKENNKDDKQDSEEYLQAEFLQSLEELRYLGFIKSTKRKTDHVAKISWMR